MRTSLLTAFFVFILLGSLSGCGMGNDMTKDDLNESNNSERSETERNGVYDGNVERDWMMNESEPGNPYHKNAPNDKNHTPDTAKRTDELAGFKKQILP